MTSLTEQQNSAVLFLKSPFVHGKAAVCVNVYLQCHIMAQFIMVYLFTLILSVNLLGPSSVHFSGTWTGQVTLGLTSACLRIMITKIFSSLPCLPPQDIKLSLPHTCAFAYQFLHYSSQAWQKPSQVTHFISHQYPIASYR